MTINVETENRVEILTRFLFALDATEETVGRGLRHPVGG